MPIVNTITLPQDVLERVDRVLEFHQSTRHTNESVRLDPYRPDPAHKPYEFRVFEEIVAEPLPTGLIDLATPTLSLMEHGLLRGRKATSSPPQDLKTLATWLHFADGIAHAARPSAACSSREPAPATGTLPDRAVRRRVRHRRARARLLPLQPARVRPAQAPRRRRRRSPA